MWWRINRSRTLNVAVLLLILTQITGHPAAASEPEMILAEIELNGEVKGDFILLREGDDRYWLKEEDWARLRLILLDDTPREEVDEERYRLIDCTSAIFECTLDVGAARLTIVADPHRLKKSEIILQQRERPDLIETSSGFLNYSLTYYGTEGGERSFTVPIEMGWRAGKWITVSDFAYSHVNGEDHFTRQFTSIQRHDVYRRNRLVIGDFGATSGSVLGGGGAFGGIAYSSDFSLDPSFIRLPGLEISGLLQYPSEVEILVDGHTIARENLPPGPFDLTNITGRSGLTDSTVVIRDPFGNERRFDTSAYVPQGVLREGIQEYSYAFGFQRENLGRENFDYGTWSLLGFHRMGLTPWVTLGAHAELDKDVANAGIEGGFLLGRWGELSFDLTGSRGDGEWGAAVALAYHYVADRIFSSLVARGFSDDYATLDLLGRRQSVHYDSYATIGYSFSDWGQLILNHRERRHFNGYNDRDTGIRFRISLLHGLGFNASYTHYWETDEHRAFAGLNFFFGDGFTGGSHYSNDDGLSTAAISLQKTPRYYNGFGYRLGAGYQEGSNEPFSYDGDVSYYGPFGEYRAGLIEAGGRRSYRANVSGGLAILDGGVHPGPPLRTGYALVDVGVPDVEVKLNNNRLATTGRSGKALLAGLHAYYENTISVDTQKIPIYYSVPKSQKHVATYGRGGVIVDLPVLTTKPIYGKLVIVDGGKRQLVEYWRLHLKDGDKKREYLIGKRGEFYIEDLPPGRFQTEAVFDDRACHFELHVPNTEDVTINLGEVTCEMGSNSMPD